MSNPKFLVGEAVMIRSIANPQFNCDFCIITGIEYGVFQTNWDGIGVNSFAYAVSSNNFKWHEEALRPIPKEQPNGIDASEFIKDLMGATA